MLLSNVPDRFDLLLWYILTLIIQVLQQTLTIIACVWLHNLGFKLSHTIHGVHFGYIRSIRLIQPIRLVQPFGLIQTIFAHLNDLVAIIDFISDSINMLAYFVDHFLSLLIVKVQPYNLLFENVIFAFINIILLHYLLFQIVHILLYFLLILIIDLVNSTFEVGQFQSYLVFIFIWLSSRFYQTFNTFLWFLIKLTSNQFLI